jgi:5-methylcytosine-specific restriction endonuclease McrA
MPRGGEVNGKRRDEVLRRDGFRCVYCDVVLPAAQLTVDHVEPRMRGGDASAGNVVTCCTGCNTAKGGRPAWSFLADRPDLRANFLRNAVHVWPRLLRAIEEAANS